MPLSERNPKISRMKCSINALFIRFFIVLAVVLQVGFIFVFSNVTCPKAEQSCGIGGDDSGDEDRALVETPPPIDSTITSTHRDTEAIVSTIQPNDNEIVDISLVPDSPPVTPDEIRPQKFGYACVGVNDGYTMGCIVVAKSLAIVTSNISDIIILVYKEVSPEILEQFSTIGPRVIVRVIEPVMEIEGYYQHSFSKLRVWKLTEYSKIVFLDSDVVVLRCLDHLFDHSELSAPPEVLQQYFSPKTFTSAIFVCEPSLAQYDRLVALLDEQTKKGTKLADMDLLNMYFADWHPISINHLVISWMFRTGVVVQDLLSVTLVLHYSGKKPWNKPGFENEPIMRQLNNIWWRVYETHDSFDKSVLELRPE